VNQVRLERRERWEHQDHVESVETRANVESQVSRERQESWDNRDCLVEMVLLERKVKLEPLEFKALEAH